MQSVHVAAFQQVCLILADGLNPQLPLVPVRAVNDPLDFAALPRVEVATDRLEGRQQDKVVEDAGGGMHDYVTRTEPNRYWNRSWAW